MNIKEKLYKSIYFISTGLGIGHIISSGTVASISATFFWLKFLYFINIEFYKYIILLSVIIGTFVCHFASKYIKKYDHKSIVLDEFVGMWISLFIFFKIPIEEHFWKWILANFLIFRFFDIKKPWPISLIQRNFQNGIGVMLDDIFSGIFTNIFIFIFYILIHFNIL